MAVGDRKAHGQLEIIATILCFDASRIYIGKVAFETWIDLNTECTVTYN